MKNRNHKSRSGGSKGRQPMMVFSKGKALFVVLGDAAASVIGSYMSSVGWFVSSGDIKALERFRGRSVEDLAGKRYPLETDPNVLYQLTHANGGINNIYDQGGSR